MRTSTLVRVLMAGGIVATTLGASKYHAASVADPPYDFTASTAFVPALVFSAFLLLAAYAMGLPDSAPTRRRAIKLGLAVPATAAIGISLVQLAAGVSLLPRFVVFTSCLVLAPFLVLCARIGSDVASVSRRGERVLVIGDVADVSPVALDLETRPELPATLVGIMTLDEARPTRAGQPVLDAVAASQVTLIVLDTAAQNVPGVVRQVARLHRDGVRVRTLLDFYEEWLGKLPVTELERTSLFFDIAELHGRGYGNLKRMVDVAGAFVLAAFALAVAPFVVAANRVGNRGPLLFRQTRVGKDGVEFQILKFRSMIPDGGGARWTAVDDSRITGVGRFLRASHIDEFPQAWNVLRGDLSLVGPRPEQPRYVDELAGKLPFYSLRHVVRPGLSGWAQVKYGYAGDTADALEKLQYEFFYLRHQSLALDARIAVRTLRSIAGGSGTGR